MTLSSYGKIYQVGHREVRDVFKHRVVIEEKIDGSQISFGVIDGELFARSKNVMLDIESPDGMFTDAILSIIDRKDLLTPGYTYRGEYLQRPKHNTLKYENIPVNNIIIFDIDRGIQDYMDPMEKEVESSRIGLECVPVFFDGEIGSLEQMTGLLDRKSILGGCTIEGFVVKCYGHYGADKKTLMCKYVSEAFKETNKKNWKVTKHAEVKSTIGDRYRTNARWDKAVQFLKESGELTDSPKDIGNLMKRVKQDVLEECKDEIAEELFNWAWKDIQCRLTTGLPQWYKEKLASLSFTEQS